jgi:hypothetical protein
MNTTNYIKTAQLAKKLSGRTKYMSAWMSAYAVRLINTGYTAKLPKVQADRSPDSSGHGHHPLGCPVDVRVEFPVSVPADRNHLSPNQHELFQIFNTVRLNIFPNRQISHSASSRSKNTFHFPSIFHYGKRSN